MKRSPLSNFDFWVFLSVMAVGRIAQLSLIGAFVALLAGWWTP